MKLEELGEFGLIEKIRRANPTSKGIRLGIGDDAAWVDWRKRSLLVTSDLLIEGVHFDLRWTTFFELGLKALAVNLSDLAAMGGKPCYFVLSLGIPARLEITCVQELLRGMKSLSSQVGAALVGGDTSAAERLFINVCLIGYAPFGAISRSGAGVGDDLYVTGTLGDSALGLNLLKTKQHRMKKPGTAYLLERHRFPVARLQAGAMLAQKKLARAMIDVSDGLVQDLGHLCKASTVGAVVWENALPLSRSYRMRVGSKGTSYALTGGEDYELLFSARARSRPVLEKMSKELGVRITRIGACVSAAQGIRVLDSTGNRLSLSALGYDHFKN
jgi:thiamine-monophosphate kinase